VIESAPATMPITKARIFAVAFAPPGRAIRNRPSSSPRKPQRSANAATGANPAHDTKFGSSKSAVIALPACESSIPEMPFRSAR